MRRGDTSILVISLRETNDVIAIFEAYERKHEGPNDRIGCHEYIVLVRESVYHIHEHCSGDDEQKPPRDIFRSFSAIDAYDLRNIADGKEYRTDDRKYRFSRNVPTPERGIHRFRRRRKGF